MLPEDDEIDDDELYEIMIWLSGSKVRFEGQSHFMEFGDGIKKVSNSRMFYPHRDNWQVHKLTVYLPIYIIRPTFEGIKRLVEELDLPSGPRELYYSRLYSGGEYVTPTGQRIEKYEKYTVEAFGLKMEPTPPLSYPLKYEIPDPSQYSTPPKYWQNSHREIIQIWRLRIFDCPLEALETTAANPLSPYHPNTLYLEERWHPNRPRLVFLGGLSDVNISFLPELKRFFCDAYRILERLNPKGRPPGTSTYSSSNAFCRRMKKELREFRKSEKYKPTEKQIAFKMGISESTFKRHLRIAGLSWRDL
ncbi:MAG: hypothetical protein QOJ02_4261 [Acidobacteriota bacterium]|jgi:hypothetical protein|nr:hypothetical protein [Acidobacteriota bacterium]